MKRRIKAIKSLLLAMLLIVSCLSPVSSKKVEAEETLTKLTWADFGVPYESSYTSERWFTYSAATMNNTAFEDDVIFTAGSGFMYATSNGWHGLQIGVNSEGKFFAKGNNYSDTTGEAVYDASAFGLTTLVDQRLTLRIEMREVTDTTAKVKVSVNGIPAGDEFSIQKAESSNIGTLGNVLAFCNNSSGGTVTIPAQKENLTKLTWADFSGVTYGTTYTSENSFAYPAAATMNNTAFEDDVIFTAGSGFMYATSNGWHGLQIGVNSEGKFFAKGNNYSDTTGGAVYDASAFGLTTLIEQRLTLRIEMREVTDTTAKVRVFVNDISAGDEFTITKSDNSAVQKLGTVLAFGTNDKNPVTVPNKKVEVPTNLTEISWEDFGITGGVTYSSSKRGSASHLADLNNTLFNGDVVFSANSQLRYGGGNDGWFGVYVSVDSNGRLSIGSMGGSPNPAVSNVDPVQYGLTSFAGVKFNLKIATTDLTGTTAKVSVWVNDQIVGDTFTHTKVGDNAVFGTYLRIPANGAAITPYSIRKTAPTGLAEIHFSDWRSDVDSDGKLLNGEITGKNPKQSSLLGTSLKETVKLVVPSGRDTSSDEQMFCYGGYNDNSWLGIRIQLSGENMRLYLCGVAGGEEYILKPDEAGIGSSFVGTEYTWQVDMQQLGNHVLVYMSYNGILYHNAPFVFADLADKIGNTIEYTSSGNTARVNDYYIVLGPSVKTLADLYHDLDKGAYTVPAGLIRLEKKTVADAGTTWIDITRGSVSSLDSAGDYKVEYNDGISSYIQEIILYRAGDTKHEETDAINVRDLVRELKYIADISKPAYKCEEKAADVNKDGVIDTNTDTGTNTDVVALRRKLLGTYAEEETRNIMPVAGYFGPVGSTLKDESFRLIQQAGINTMIQFQNQYTDIPLDRYYVYQQLTMAQKYGLGITVQDQRLTADPATVTAGTIQSAIANYKDYQSFAGLYVTDEPNGSTYPYNRENTINKYAPLAKKINEAGVFAYANLHGYVYDASVRKQGFYEYATYLREYVDQFQATFLSYDNYPFSTPAMKEENVGNGVEDAKRYFENLAMARYISKEKNIPFWAFVQCGDGFESSDITANNPSEGEFKWQANTSLAFGAKGIQYFPLVQPDSFYNIDSGTCSSGLLDRNGNKTEWYPYALAVNQQIAAVDQVLMNATNDGLMATGGYAKTQAADKVAEMVLYKKGFLGILSKQGEITTTVYTDGYYGARVTSTDAAYGALTGCFTYGDRHALYIVNYNVTDANTVTVSFDSETTAVYTYHAATQEAAGSSFDVTLGAGEAVLVVF